MQYLSVAGNFADGEEKEILAGGTVSTEDEVPSLFRLGQFPLQKMVMFDQRYLLSDCYNMKTDRMTMGNSLEARIPYLDVQLVEFYNRFALWRESIGTFRKTLLCKAMKDILPSRTIRGKSRDSVYPSHFG